MAIPDETLAEGMKGRFCESGVKTPRATGMVVLIAWMAPCRTSVAARPTDATAVPCASRGLSKLAS